MALSIAEIKRFISDDISSERKRLAAVGERYYNAEHDILNCRLFYYNADGKLVEDTYRANSKISHPFFTELSDQFSSHVLSFEENPIRAKEGVEGLQEHLDQYFDGAFWAECGDMITGAYNKGFEYMYGYKRKDGRTKFQHADSMGVVEVRAQDTDDKCSYIIYWYIDRIDKGRKTVKKIQVWSEKEICYYVQAGATGKIKLDDSVEINPRPHAIFTDEDGKKMCHPLGYMPFWRVDYNKKRISGLKPIKDLIDDYDVHSCALSNNLKDFDSPLYVVSGFEGDNLDELQTNLKTKKVVGVGEGGNVTIQTVEIPYQARKEKLDIDEKNIYRFGMGLNTVGLKDTSATTNMVIRAAYSLLELKTKKFMPRLEAFLDQLLEVVLAEINQKLEKDYQRSDIVYKFKRHIPTNETEDATIEKTKAETKQIEITTILNAAAEIGDEKALQAICEVLDIDFKDVEGQLEKLKEEENLKDAKKALEGVVTDEQTAEDSSGTIPE